MKKSNFLRLNLLDYGKGVLVALGAFSLNYLQVTFIPSMDISPEIKTLMFSGIAYLTKNFLSKPKTE